MVDKKVLKRCWEIDIENFNAPEEKNNSKMPRNTYNSKLKDLKATWSNIRQNTKHLEKLLKDITES